MVKVKLKDRVANLYHKQQGIPRAGHVLNQPVSIAEAMQDAIHSGWMLKCGFSVRSWKRRYFVLTNTGLFYYKSDKSSHQQGEILLSHISDVSKSTGPQDKPHSIAITTSDRIFIAVGSDEEDAQKWMDSLNSKVAAKVVKARAATEIDPESFPPMCQEAEVIANELTQLKKTLLESFNEGSVIIQKQMTSLQEKFEYFEREYGYIAQAQQLGIEIRECLDSCVKKLVDVQAEEEAQFQASKIRSKANWLKDAIDVGDPEQLARHIHEMRTAYVPFREKYGLLTPVKSVQTTIKEFDNLLNRADSALSLIDENLDKLDGIDVIVGKITWLSGAIERGNIQDLQKHIQEMKEILASFEEKHEDMNNNRDSVKTNQGQELLEKAERRLNKLQRQLPDSPMSISIPPQPQLDLSTTPAVTLTQDGETPADANQIATTAPGTGGMVLTKSQDRLSELKKSAEIVRSGSGTGSGLLSTQVYCSFKHTGKTGRLQKYVVCLTCENYGATICLNCRDVCHAGHDVTYEREAECACHCGMGSFSVPCACFVSQVTRKSATEIDEIHKQILEVRRSRTIVGLINEISIFANTDPPKGWADTTRDPCGLIFSQSSKKDQGFTSEMHKTNNLRVVFAHQAILKGMNEAILCSDFTDNDPIYGRVYLPVAPALIPVSAFPGEDVVYSKVSCFTGIVLYVDGQLWLPPSSSALPSANSFNSSQPTSPRRKFTQLPPTQPNASPSLSSVPSRRHHMGHVRSQSHAGSGYAAPSSPSISPLPASYHPPTAVAAAAASVSAVTANAPVAIASVVARKSISRRDSMNRIRRFSFNSAQPPPPIPQCTCNNSNTCASCLATTRANTTSPTLTLASPPQLTSPPLPALPIAPGSPALHFTNPQSLAPPPRSSPRQHSRNNSSNHGPTIGGGTAVPEASTALVISNSATNVPNFYEAGGSLPALSVNGNGVGEVLGSPITPPNHFFELSMASGEPQWEWTTYRLMLSPTPNDPDVKIYQTQISNWQKVVMNLTPGTHKIRLEIALGPNPPIRYCVASGEFNYTVTEEHTNKVKKAEQEAVRALVVKEWKDKYTYGTVESDSIGKWVYQMDGSLKCLDGPHTGAEYFWSGDKLEKKSGGLDCVFECNWHPNKHPPELDVHFLPELATCGFTISHPYPDKLE